MIARFLNLKHFAHTSQLGTVFQYFGSIQLPSSGNKALRCLKYLATQAFSSFSNVGRDNGQEMMNHLYSHYKRYCKCLSKDKGVTWLTEIFRHTSQFILSLSQKTKYTTLTELTEKGTLTFIHAYMSICATYDTFLGRLCFQK